MLVLYFFPFLFSLVLTAFPPHLELSYDLDDIPIAFSTIIKPYINFFFQNYALASDPYVFTFSKTSSNAISNYTLIASNIRLKNLSVDWNNTKIIPSDNNTFSIFVKRANASVCFNYNISQNSKFKDSKVNNPCILNAKMINAYFARIVQSMHAPSEMEQFKGERLSADLSIVGCPRIIKNTVGNATKYILKIPAEFYLGWK